MTKEDMEKGYLLNDNANDKEVSHEGTSSDQGRDSSRVEVDKDSLLLQKKRQGICYSFPLKFSSCFPSTSA